MEIELKSLFELLVWINYLILSYKVCLWSLTSFKSQKWKETVGIIAKNEFQEVPSSEYIERVQIMSIKYSVNNITYFCSRLSFFPINSIKGRVSGKLKPGAEISVFYDPANPSDSVVIKGIIIELKIMWLFMIFLFATVLLFFRF